MLFLVRLRNSLHVEVSGREAIGQESFSVKSLEKENFEKALQRRPNLNLQFLPVRYALLLLC